MRLVARRRVKLLVQLRSVAATETSASVGGVAASEASASVGSVGGNDVSRRKCGTREVRCEIVDAGKLDGGHAF